MKPESVAGAGMTRKRALILKMGAIGDVITAVPAARALYEEGFQIHWICGNSVLRLLECYSWIQLIPVDDSAILKGNLIRRLQNIIRLWRRIALRNWDLVATLYFDRRYRLLVFPARGKRKVALSSRFRETNLLTVRSYSDEFARILCGWPDECRPRSLEPLRPDRLPALPITAKRKARRIALVPGGTSNLIAQQTLRRWPIENYVATARELCNRDWEVLLLGGSEDLWVRPFFEGMEVIDCISRVSVPEVISVCDTCDVVISHDTGPMHLAGLSKALILAIFGPTNPGHVLPRRPGVVALWGGQQFACRPCYDLRSYAPCASAECIKEITPGNVIEQMDRLIRAHNLGSGLSSDTVSSK